MLKIQQSSPYEIKSSVLWSPQSALYKCFVSGYFQGIWGLLVYVFSRKTNTMPARSSSCFKNPDFDHLDAIDHKIIRNLHGLSVGD